MGVSVDIIVWHHLTLDVLQKIIVNGNQLLCHIKQLLDFYTKYWYCAEVYCTTIVSMRCVPAI